MTIPTIRDDVAERLWRDVVCARRMAEVNNPEPAILHEMLRERVDAFVTYFKSGERREVP